MATIRRRAALVVAMVALAGCMSTPEATPERDAEAKQFKPRADAAVIYVYRDDVGASGMASDDPVLYVDDRLVGATLPLTYFRLDERAGEHLLHGFGYDQGKLRLLTRNGEIYFVSLKAVSGTSYFQLVKPETGKREILRCCTLLENWAPAQRPFLY